MDGSERRMWENQTVTDQYSDKENQAGRETDAVQVHWLPGSIREHHEEQRPLGSENTQLMTEEQHADQTTSVTL